MPVAIRKFCAEDAAAVARLFHETVHRVNAADYTPSQLRAWSPAIRPDAFWRRRFRQHRVLVAVVGETLAGFVEWRADGYIEAFFVHHAFQRQGVGRLLMLALFQAARGQGIASLRADVSITAQPFFRSMGFQLVRRSKRFYRNRVFRQYRMDRSLRR